MSNQPLRIAAIGMRGIPSNYSGIERGSENIYSILAERGHQVTIYCRPECLSASEDVYRGMRLVRTPALDSRSAGTVSHVCSSFLHAIATRNYDIIQLHALAAGLFAPLKYLTKASVVAKIHGLDWQRAKWKGFASKVLLQGERSIARHLDHIIVVSRQLETYFRDEYGRATTYVPNGVKDLDTAPMGASSVLADFGLTAGEYVAYVGRLDPGKRIEDLISAFQQLPRKWKLAIVGEGRYVDDYVSKLRRMAAADPRIVFTGLQGGSDLWTLFRAAAVFVSPSESEGLPNSLLECVAQGTPAIVSDIPPHREVLGPVDGYDLFVKPGDVSQLGARLNQLLEQREHYLQIAGRVQRHVKASYSWQRSAEATESLYYAAASTSKLRAFSRAERTLPATQPR